MLVFTQRAGSDVAVAALCDEETKTILVLGTFQVTKPEGLRVKVGIELPEAIRCFRQGTGEDGDVTGNWDTVQAERRGDGWTIIDDPQIVVKVLAKLTANLGTAIREVCG